MKKFFAILLSVMLMLSLAVPASAADETGSITINDAVKDQTYTIYQILDLESYSDVGTTADENGNYKGGNYAYKATAAWADFINGTGIKDVYVTVDEQGYVQWIDDADPAEFAKLAQAYAKTNSISNQGEMKAERTTVTFTALDLGYYLVDTTLGTLCSLDTTNPNVVMKEKNEAPSITKEVQEDFDNSWDDNNDADINQTVNFKAIITVQAGAENYVMYDNMSAGLTWVDTVTVTVNDAAVDADNYTVTKNVTVGTGENAVTYDFAVVFKNEYIATLDAGTKIEVSYSATLNENAVVGLPGNPNDVILKYGDETKPSWTPKDTTITYTWDMEVLKYANGVESNVLAGVKFVLLNNDKNKVAAVENGKLTGWIDVPTAGEDGAIAWPTNTILTTNNAGKIEIDGLDADTYHLREIEALDGYNKLAEDKQFEVTAATADTEDSDEDQDITELVYATPVIKVENKSGTELPETGGMGTTIFYIVGGVMAAAAVVLLITKKRMSAEG